MPAKLKVYRTAIGFHDAYVATPSQKAALEAWGSDKNLFARGAAELVDDEALTAEPLASPGKVIKRLRGTTAEQIAALPPDKPKRTTTAKEISTAKPKRSKPSRADLDQAERAVAELRQQHEDQRQALEQRRTELVREQKKLEQTQRDEHEAAQSALDKAQRAYERAVEQWDGSD